MQQQNNDSIITVWKEYKTGTYSQVWKSKWERVSVKFISEFTASDWKSCLILVLHVAMSLSLKIFFKGQYVYDYE